jgi:agmatine deiminase
VDIAVRKVTTAYKQGAEIICLPELFRSEYFPQFIGLDISSLVETISGPSIQVFSSLAKQMGVVLIVPLLLLKSDREIGNAVVVIDGDGTVFPPYFKVHIPQDPCFFEKEYFYPGSKYCIFETKFGKISPLICYDQWFPEAARCVALDGAEIIFYPTAIGDVIDSCPQEGEWQESWEIIQRSHAIANSVHVAAVNRVGTEGKIRFFGGSFVCDAFGGVLARAGSDEEILIVQVDLSMNQVIRDSWGFFRNRRPDTYHSVCTPVRNVHRGNEIVLPGDTPRNRGYHMPAEWEHHEQVWISWPHNTMTFPFIDAVEEGYIQFILAVHPSEHVSVLVLEGEESRISQLLVSSGVDMTCVTLYPMRYADVWIRDYGPTFVVNRGERKIAMVHWIFNAWGDKYDELLSDGCVPALINEHLQIPVYEPGIILEGGSIDLNGRGTVLTTRSCLLNKNRNPSLSIEDIEGYLQEYLGVVKVIWLNDGLVGDDTDGHVDDIARFVGPSTVVCAYEDDITDENYRALQENFEILSRETDQDGTPLTVIRLPMPAQVADMDGRYPASYTNFYIGNRVVIVPTFRDAHDELACSIIQKIFTDRTVIGIDARAMIEGYGAFHCATQQQPSI